MKDRELLECHTILLSGLIIFAIIGLIFCIIMGPAIKEMQHNLERAAIVAPAKAGGE